MRRAVILFVLTCSVAGAALAFAVPSRPSQPKVAARALPTVRFASQSDVFVDCSKINSVAYFPDNPCETFVLLTAKRFRSARGFWTAEVRKLRAAGWRHSARQEVDYNGQGGHLARLSESWVSRDHRKCAYVATLPHGLAGEKREIFPRDPYDIPSGLYAFYHRATKARSDQSLWVRLRPPNNHGGHCID